MFPGRNQDLPLYMAGRDFASTPARRYSPRCSAVSEEKSTNALKPDVIVIPYGTVRNLSYLRVCLMRVSCNNTSMCGRPLVFSTFCVSATSHKH
ncbi:hypothetical protein BDV11DRAFT_139968 [Aspergillus similis]